MRPDQYERLQKLEEQLLDAFLVEADPAQWSGAGISIAAMDKQTRGDRYWCKRNAAATGVLANRVGDMISGSQGFGGPAPAAPGESDDGGDRMDAEISSAEREAEKLMKQLTTGAGARARAKVNGRP